MVDNFCNCFMEEHDIVERLRDWNEVQAIIRQSSGAMTPCFVTIHVTALAIFGLILWHAVTGEVSDLKGVGPGTWLVALGPGLVVMFSVFKVLLLAAEVTSHCARVPAFINSLDLDL